MTSVSVLTVPALTHSTLLDMQEQGLCPDVVCSSTTPSSHICVNGYAQVTPCVFVRAGVQRTSVPRMQRHRVHDKDVLVVGGTSESLLHSASQHVLYDPTAVMLAYSEMVDLRKHQPRLQPRQPSSPHTSGAFMVFDIVQ